MTQKDILKKISTTGLVDYQFLSQKATLKLIPKVLNQLLKEADTHFETLLKLADDKISFSTLMDPFLTGDQHLSTLFKAIESLNGTNSSPTTRKIVMDFQPKLVAYANKVSLNHAIYEKLKRLQKKPLSPEQKRSLALVIRNMEIAGVHLEENKRKQLEKINVSLSELAEKFEQNTIDGRANFFYDLHEESILGEMPESDKEAAKQEAKAKKSKAKYRFTLSQPSYIAIMRYCKDGKVREKFYKANHQVATTGKWDNRPIALKILKLREEKARLLGFKHYTEYILQERMAPSFEAIEKLIKEVGQKAKKAAEKNINDLKRYSGQKTLNDWDLSYYSEKLKKEKYSVDDKLLRAYFPLDQVIDGLFGLMKTLFGVEIKAKKTKSYHPEVRVYEVYDQGKLISHYLLDPFARPEKRGGAWANDLRSGWTSSRGKKMIPIVINVCNFAKGIGKKPSLLTHRDVETLFHEFGHAIHVMLSSSGNLANLNGFHTEWDFVEMPSQILENWCWEEKALKGFAKHVENKKVIPKALIEKMKASQTFMSGLFLMRQNEFGFLDLLLHSQPTPKNVKALDEHCLEIANRFSALPKFKDYKMYASFGHIFAGGYAAGYYSYVWAEVLEADIFEAIRQAGAMSGKVGKKYANLILRQGTKKPASELVKDFLGRKPNTKAFFRKHKV